jgi:hypothetical protein
MSEMTAKQPIRFDLLANARDSLRRAVSLLTWDEDYSEHATLKHAITNAAHAIELLLKERLRRENPAFVWHNVDKYPSLEAQTVTTQTAMARLKVICGISFTDADMQSVASLRITRNAIEHYEWIATEAEARVIVGKALSFAFAFAEEHLNIDLSQDFKKDDTWRLLIAQADAFTQAHSERKRKSALDEVLETCSVCYQETVTSLGSCILCGHWQPTLSAL